MLLGFVSHEVVQVYNRAFDVLFLLGRLLHRVALVELGTRRWHLRICLRISKAVVHLQREQVIIGLLRGNPSI